ncbi:DUF3099 domain-containing protein [Nesterenkonia alkaliphila]|uniref:DUF3099 domain-containing protein n=1 Tax=Nesterenkonia alkaliphila TaxID=1463631 RepID=A0A7K1ULM5_9MICC|nr:DUF3099 domain-containing protein [Nesterenkonia alkaliphila]MVT27324.1 DUF3099 domain-containing protein [Nesterenkonia alkaliphila]GFZ80798.1 hypothetical protein GCM10011359_06650 [Nesterenkonia alkaliphila]
MTSEVHTITDAPVPHSAEQHSRMMRYAVAMSIRTVCFVLAILVGAVWQSWWALAFVVGAAVLPYIAVVNANAGGDRYRGGVETLERNAQRRLGTGAQEPEAEPAQWWEEENDDAAPHSTQHEAVISGELAEDEPKEGTD